MTTYFGLWKLNTSLPPPQDPRVELQQNVAFEALMKQQIDSGDVKEVYTFLEGGSGYFITGDISEEKLHENLLAWSPYIQFELHRTVAGLKSVESLVRVSRARASALKVPA